MKRNKKGFTIVELVIVIGVIGILSAILIPTFVSLNDQAQKAQLQSNLHNAFTAYVADAVDGKYGDAETSSIYLQYVAQDKVVMEKTINNVTERYNFNGSEWVKYTGDLTNYEYAAYTELNNVKTYDSTKSVYNSYTVYCLQQA